MLDTNEDAVADVVEGVAAAVGWRRGRFAWGGSKGGGGKEEDARIGANQNNDEARGGGSRDRS